MTTSNSNSSNDASCTPCVSALYFQSHDGGSSGRNDDFQRLPAELLKHCLVDYMDWGDLAKLSTVQSSWKTLMMDGAADSSKRQWRLAQALLEGTNGLQKNPSQAIRLLQQLSGVTIDNDNDGDDSAVVVRSKPFAPALQRLADCYLTGNGVDSDKRLGLRYLKVAYDTAHDNAAAHTLATIYEHGLHNTDIDVYKAAEWYLLAAKRGHVESMAEYGLCCELGCGRDQSDEEALEWYMKAAEHGHVTAKYSVGEAFEEARGVPQSDEEACLWYYKAAVDGDVDSKKALRRLRDIARIVVPGVGALLDV